jgi:ABC-type branched-subunit amino acid transport system permease subunit
MLTMIKKSTIQRTILGIGIILLLTLTGIFNTFANQMVVPEQLSLNTVIIIGMVGMLGYAVAYPLKQNKPLVIMGNAIFGTLGLAVVWIIAVWFTSTVDTRFVLQNLTGLNPSPLTFGETVRFVATETDAVQLGGLGMLVLFCAMMGAVAGFAVLLPMRLQQIFGISAVLTVVFSLVSSQIGRIITLPDALAFVIAFFVSYAVSWLLNRGRELPNWVAIVVGLVIGVGVAVALLLIGNEEAFGRDGVLRGLGSRPQIIDMGVRGLWWGLIAVLGITGMAGALAPKAERLVHNMSIYFMAFMAVLGLLNTGGRSLPLHIPLSIFAVLVMTVTLAPPLGDKAEYVFRQLKRPDRRQSRIVFLVALAGVVLAAPQFMGVSLANNVNLIILYATLGIGLNVMIGYAGLLDLGFVASIAIGAYTIGILTGPNILTCDGVAINPNLITLEEINRICTGRIDFWGALPIAVVLSAVTGMLLGVPVLGLRGDYLAIVTLGFGEIVGRIIYSDKFKPLVGGAQGLSPIYPPKIFFPQWESPLPMPSMFSSVNGSGITILFGNAVSMFYLYIFAFLLAIFVTYRLSISRQGRSWRALRADEDVAQAMGIHTIRTKLMAFGVSSAIGGLGGAILAAQLQSVTPENYKLAFSINVLALVIIGGMGSIPGVILGAVVLAGLPELLRQLESYRLLAFGGLLVLVMLVRPEGLLPPKPPRLTEQARLLAHPEPTGTD